MSTAAQPTDEPRVRSIEVTDLLITGHLEDGRIISIPLNWSWRLADATPEQRANYEIIGEGTGIHWPGVDEDLSVRGMLNGTQARRPPTR